MVSALGKIYTYLYVCYYVLARSLSRRTQRLSSCVLSLSLFAMCSLVRALVGGLRNDIDDGHGCQRKAAPESLFAAPRTLNAQTHTRIYLLLMSSRAKDAPCVCVFFVCVMCARPVKRCTRVSYVCVCMCVCPFALPLFMRVFTCLPSGHPQSTRWLAAMRRMFLSSGVGVRGGGAGRWT